MIIRNSGRADAAPMAELLNEIIAQGGTTAHEHALTPDAVCQHFIDGPGVETSVIAQIEGQMVGWQSLGLWRAEIHIGTFVRIGTQAKGIGAALFARTKDLARAQGLTTIIAHIRADNAAGLTYYARMGFVVSGGEPAFALQDGTVVGRIFRRYDLSQGIT